MGGRGGANPRVRVVIKKQKSEVEDIPFTSSLTQKSFLSRNGWWQTEKRTHIFSQPVKI